MNQPQTKALLTDTAGLDEVEALMRDLAVGSHLDRAGALVQEHLSTGGKRIRARLALEAARALGVSRSAAVPWAAAVELIHNASLVHDDIQDGDRMRRGHPTLWAHHGVAQAINAGDLMLMLPILAISRIPAPPAVRWQLSEAVARRAAATVRGQTLELALLATQRLDWTSWTAAASGKTGELLALPVEGAALLAGLDPDEARQLGDELGQLGLLFQLQDDLLDLYGDKGRAQPGSDLREGKVSSLVVAHLERYPADREALVELLKTPRDEVKNEDVLGFTHAFRAGGAVDRVLLQLGAVARAVRRSPELRAHPDILTLALALVHAATRPIAHLLPTSDIDARAAL